jgi:3-deoxy-D-manno-octulosonic-acid transferase
LKLLYNTGLKIYFGLIALAAKFNKKAALFTSGRKNWEIKLQEKIEELSRQGKQEVVWVHCSSAGEFEQGRTLIDRIRFEKPQALILLTFFSPSGYELRKNYPNADIVFYLPLDTKKNAVNFLSIVNPSVAIFIKYEFWYNFLHELAIRKIPVYVISAIFRKEQVFFKWYGGLFRQMLKSFTMILVQDENSVELLAGIGIGNCKITGDTRFDRVAEINGNCFSVPVAQYFADGNFCLVAGSTWDPDEKLIVSVQKEEKFKLIIAPHEIESSHIEKLRSIFGRSGVIVFSECLEESDHEALRERCRRAGVLIIDTIGMLSSLYRYASAAYIGGGFGKGIHNILEPSTFGIPVMFGPVHKKFREANILKSLGGAFEINNAGELDKLLSGFINDKEFLKRSGEISGNYVRENLGATELTFREIFRT